MPIRLNILLCTSCVWIRMLPPAISFPLRTKSYARARALPGSFSKKGTSSDFGAVNGWWTATNRFSSSLYSSNGKSVTQRKFHFPSGTKFNRCAISSRRVPRMVNAFCHGPDIKRIISPGFASNFLAIAFDSSCVINFPAEHSTLSPVTLKYTSPPAPSDLT